jgi:hypothetical protein
VINGSSMNLALEILKPTLGAIAGAVAKPAIDALLKSNRSYRSRRRDAIVGTWVGAGGDFYVEDSSQGKFQFTLRLALHTRGNLIRGKGSLTGSFPEASLVLSGAFQSESFVQLTYRNANLHILQSGVIAFRLDGTGTRLTGGYAGSAPMRGTFIAGEVSLQKIETGD